MAFKWLVQISLAATTLLLVACGDKETLSEAALITTPQGPVQGVTTDDPDIFNFKGIPYAQAPVGDLRWRAPLPAPAWSETRAADTFSAMCMQPIDTNGTFFKRIIDGHGLSGVKKALITRVVAAQPVAETSEDCLYLNVRTGNLGGDEKQPVMVWIHGGGHQFGSSDFSYYQTNGLVKEDVVLVTINYRLGAFGYMSHPALSADDPNGVSGNYGTLDQMAALKWVRDNISAYGGDPDNVTIFGESAGAWSVTELMTSPLSKGLFHKAIGQSGASTYHLGQMVGNPVGWVSGYETGAKVQAALGLGNPSATDLRAVPADDIMSVLTEDMAEGFHHVRDGYVFPESVGTAFLNQSFNTVPVLFGYNTDEATLFFPTDSEPTVWVEGFPREGRDVQRTALAEHFGDKAETLIDLYGLDKAGNFDAAGTQFMGDEIFGVNVRFTARQVAKTGQASYLYTFARVPPSKKQTLGAFHAAEIPFVFDSHEKILGLSQDDENLTDAIQSYWTNFAKTGNPNGEGLMNWPEHRGKSWMQFGGNNDVSTTVITDFRDAKLNALEVGLLKKLTDLEAAVTPPTDQAQNQPMTDVDGLQ